jgi:ketosteroid isomerase-like protein
VVKRWSGTESGKCPLAIEIHQGTLASAGATDAVSKVAPVRAGTVRVAAMGEAEVRLYESWREQLASVEDPLDFMYVHVWAPDIEHRAIEGAPDDVGPIIGRDAMRAYVNDWYDMFADLEVVPEEIIDAGPERVGVVRRLAGTARASGVATEMRLATLYTIRGGKVVRGREYATRDQALAAAASEG